MTPFKHPYWLILLVLLLAAAPAAAQNTPQPEQGYILGWSQESLFPQAIRFTLTTNLPAAQLTTAMLTIQPAGQGALLINVPLDDTTIQTAEPFSEIAYIWELPADTPPVLFQDITLGWDVTTTSGELARVTDTFTFTDERATWRRYDDPLGVLNLVMPISAAFPDPASGESDMLRKLRGDLQSVYALLSANTDRVPALTVMVYNDGFDPGCTLDNEGNPVAVAPGSKVSVPCNADRTNAIFATSGLDVVTAGPSLIETRTALIDYLVERFYGPTWGDTAIPAWFRSGLTQFYQPGYKGMLLPPLQAASRSNHLYTLDEMAQSPVAGADVALWEAQSYGMVLVIADQMSVPRLYRLARDAGSAASFADAYQAAAGQPLEALLPGFSRWLFTAAGADAFTFTAYLPTTPTPTPTATATHTLTPTPSDTATLTPTVTITGTLSPTPFPSSTPTPVPATLTPSVTPRPAGSLRTPTATPIPEVPPLSQPVPALGVLAVGLIAVAFIIGGLLRLRRG
ncbi:MAG: hypothetical protein H6672_08295 [Anaerolineaceae bacterium]|nr:hypothetical protein [Anaerolineaceae bacterium]